MSNKLRLPEYTVNRVVQSLSQVIGWGVSHLKVPATWSITQGEGKTVMVIDTGYSDHEDLQDAVIKDKSISFIKGEGIEDLAGHSTHCLGIIGARNNESGMVGVAPKCNMIAVKVLGEDGTGPHDGIVRALEYAKTIKPDVVSMSLGSPLNDPRTHRLIKELTAMNIPIIAAAGNSRTMPVSYPAAYPEVICVTAFDKNGNPAGFNSTGPEVDFAAPGVDIYSTYLNQSYANLSGTSMATPFMAGIVCLLLAKHAKQEAETGENDCKTVDQIKEHLVKYTDDKGVIGKDRTWGYGVIDINRLLTDTKPNVGELPIANEPIDLGRGGIFKKLRDFFNSFLK